MNSVHVEVRREPTGWVCQVEVQQDGRRTHHSVRVSPSDLARWGRPGGGGNDEAAVEELVRRSFVFLLEREPASAILRSFDLSVVQRYFPEFDRLFSG